MKIKQLTITNFKSYKGKQVISLDAANDASRRIIAVGGLNGAGKTSLKDAILLGLVGSEEAMLWIYGLEKKGAEKREIDRRMTDLLNRSALEAGETDASVRIVLEDEDGVSFEIGRTWSFGRDGRFREEVLDGTIASDPISPERFRDFLKNHIPPEVVPFFIFDGEEIQRIAADDPGTQVRNGIDTILGFHLCDALSADLLKLQDDYRRNATKHNEQEADLARLEADAKKDTNEIAVIEEEQTDIEEQLDRLRERATQLAAELSDILGTNSDTNPKELQRELEETNKQITDLKRNLTDAIDRWLVPALPGTLVTELLQQIDAEDERDRWEEGKLKVQPQREKLILRLFDESAPQPEPPFEAVQTEFMRSRIRLEWDALFNPPPPGIAAQVRHGNLEPGERAQVRNKCRFALKGAGIDTQGVLTRLDALDRRARDLHAAFDKIGDRHRADEIVKEKQHVERDRVDFERRWEANKHRLVAMKHALAEILKQIRNKKDALTESSAYGAKLKFSRKVRQAVQGYEEALRPRKRTELQDNLSYMYGQLARKSDVVQRIELDPKTFAPRLLNTRGERIPLSAQSAGEKEIYALSLLWALSKSSGRELPVVIDTPLARLDSEHRENIVTRYLPEAGSQVIILSTDTELDRQNFSMIDRYLAKSIRLDFDQESESTVVRDGYFNFTK